ncbi:MAG: hypothetical protein CMO66_03835 [Verrucomicrobiales bacterium]|nr:hypothetical protein [Verrucomicrobiales bacterium]
MKRALQILLPILVMGAGAWGGAWLVLNRKVVKPVERTPFHPRVKVQKVQRGHYQPVIRSQGTVRARMAVDLSSEVKGRVVTMSSSLIDGGLFEAGDILLELDSVDYDLALRQARARMDVAQAGITNALAQMSSARAQMAQWEARISREEAEARAAIAEWKLIGRQGEPPALLAREPQLKEARAGLESAKAMWWASAAKEKSDVAELEAARAAEKIAELNVARCVIRAPFKGRVDSRMVGIGQVVSPGIALARLESVDVGVVRLALPQEDFEFLGMKNGLRGGANIVNGPKARFRSAAGGRWRGQVVRGLGEVDGGTRMVSVVAEVNDPYSELEDSTLSYGLFVSAEIDGELIEDVVVLPRIVLREGGGVHVFKKGKLHAREVEVILTTHDHVVIKGGLDEGEDVCLTPVEAFVDGMTVVLDPEGMDE